MIRRCLITSAWLLIALGPVTPSPGQGGGQPKYKVLFEQGPAYVRVTVTTDPAVPVKRTENFQVVCGLRGYQGVRSVVYRDLEIPQG